MKPIKYFLFFIIAFFFIYTDIKVDALTSISINDNDYELVCTYSDGIQLTISRNDVYIQNTSFSLSSSADSGIKFYLTSDQENDLYSDSGVSTYRHAAITENGRCPSKLYVYDLPSKYDSSSSSDDDTVSTLYYSTKNGIASEVGGTRGCGFLWLGTCDNATQRTDLTTNLISEEVYLITGDETTICDYQIPSESAYSNAQTISVFLYSNLTIAEVNGYFSTVSGDAWSSCNEGNIYINDPTQKAVADNGNGVGTGSRYNYKRFYITTSSSTCSTYNDSNACIKYSYLGTRDGNGTSANGGNVCEVLGNETVTQIKRIVNILQILVPVLTIAFSAFDIGKIVVSGNIDEELPKKKKVIIARLIVMVIFFFLPLITNLLITGLQDAGVIGIEDINCIITDK